MRSASRRFLPLLAALTGATPALADLSGKYVDTAGLPIVLGHKNTTIRVKPDLSRYNIPAHAEQALGELLLDGTATPSAKGEFELNAKFERTITPNPNAKFKVRVGLTALTQPVEGGLHMKACDWDFTIVVFAGGEIAGSENKQEKCVGLWKKVP